MTPIICRISVAPSLNHEMDLRFRPPERGENIAGLSSPRASPPLLPTLLLHYIRP